MLRHLGVIFETHFFPQQNSLNFILPLPNFHSIPLYSFCYRQLVNVKFNYGHPVGPMGYIKYLIPDV